ncbi:MAG: protein kinase domain-containing protein [Thermosulfidibacteraceae bacterium]|jgi:DNA helicase-2/ATP-dependent DNA helicase PcrA
MLDIRIGRYRLEKWLGGGRFGDVYYAIDTILGFPFALKIIKVTPDTLKEVLEEAKTLLLLEHPNIVRFFNIDIIDDRLIIVTEYLEGKSLREVIKKEAPFTLERMLFYGEQLASAIDYIHSRNVVHRDIKPENIMVLSDGRIKVVDFGIAKKDLEGDWGVGGTPIYMAPEVWQGQFLKKSDIWSFAVVVLEMLTGKNPFSSSSMDEVRKKIETPVNLRSKYPFLSERICTVLEKALSIDPMYRFNSCMEIIEGLKGDRETPVILDTTSIVDKKDSEEIELTDEQLKAVLSGERRVLVVGGPGTGKTVTLVNRVKHLIIDNSVDPSTTYVLSFSSRNTRLIEYLLRRILPGEDRVNVLTFHEFALRVIARYGYSIGFDDNFLLLSPLRRSYVEQKLIKEATEKLNIPKEVAIEVYRRFQRVRGKCGNINTFLENTSGRWNNVLKEFWNLYNDFLKTEGIFDYEDLIYLAIEVLSKNEIALEEVKGCVRHLLIDDIQDLNLLQWKLIDYFTDSTVFATCDDDQSVYSWRGATIDILESKTSSFKIYYLTKTFRLFGSLVDAANNLIVRNRSIFPKPLWTDRNSDKFYFDVRSFETPNEEAEFVCDILEILKIKEGYSYSDFAVLYRTNLRGRILQQRLKSKGIPYSFQHTASFHAREEVKLAMDLLKYVVMGTEHTRMKVIAGLRRIGVNLKDVESGEVVLGFLGDVRELDKPSLVIAHLMEILRSRGSLDIVGMYKRLEILREFYEEALDFENRSKNPTIRSFISYIKFLTDSGFSDCEDGVRLLSVYAARGLEFPVVFVVGLVEGEFPSSKSFNFQEEIEEERRLFYTAITRAKEKLFLTYYRYPSQYSRIMEKPSRFLQEMLGI